MILSTTPTIEGHPIREYRGVVTGETIIGTNFVKDFFASVRDVIGGRSGSYESTLREAKDTALREMADRAASLGCNAIVGIDLDYETDRPFRLVDLIVKNVKNGRIPWGRLVQSHRRIEKLLKKLK